jgi:hypothetical protein
MNDCEFSHAAKQREHERQDAKPPTCFIASHKTYGWQTYHIGVRRDLRYAKSGLIQIAYYVTKCSGRQLGGAWGQAETQKLPNDAILCNRCFPK